MKKDKKILVLSIFLISVFLFITLQAADTANVDKKVPDNFDINKDSIILEKNDKGVLEIKLIENTNDALINGEAIFKINFLEKQKNPLSTTQFKNKKGLEYQKIKNVQWFYYENSTYLMPQNAYNYTCVDITNSSGDYTLCNSTKYTEYIPKQYDLWIPLDSESKKEFEGVYYFKIKAYKDKEDNIDFIPNLLGVELNEFAWWNNTWTKKKPITIEGGNSELTDFKAFITVDYDSDMQLDYDDLRFLNSTETGEFSCEMDHYNSTTAQVWCNIPTLATGDNIIYMYYGSGSADNTWTTATWGTEYANIYHFSDLLDSAGNENLNARNITLLQNSTIGQSLYIKDGHYFNKTLGPSDTSIVSIIAWVNWTHPSNGVNFLVGYKPGGSGYDAGDWGLNDNDHAGEFEAIIESASTFVSDANFFTPFVAGRQEMIGFVLDGTGEQLYWNGVNVINDTSVGVKLAGYRTLAVGDYGGGISAGKNVSIDEFWWFNNTVLTADYILRVYENQNSSKITFGSEESSAIIPTATIIYPTNTTYNSTTYSYELNYTHTDGADCWYSNNSGIWNSSSVACGTNFTGLNLVDGSHKLTLYINSSTNNQASDDIDISIDTTYPLISIAVPTNSSYSSAIDLTELNYTISDLNPNTCWYTTDLGATNTTLTCGDNVTGLSASEGSNTWIVYVNDTVNNLNSSSVTFLLDTTYPQIKTNYPTNITYNWLVDALNYTISDTYLETCWYSLDEGSTNTTLTCGDNVTSLTSVEGNNIWTIWSNDSVNNVNSSSVTFITDTIYPNVSIVYPTNTTYNYHPTALNFIYDEERINTCWFTNDSGTTNQTFDCSLNLTGLNASDGSNTWTIYLNDTVNNLNSSSVTFFTDTIYPLINYTDPTPTTSTNSTDTSIFVNVTATELNEANITFLIYNSTGEYNRSTFTNSRRNITWTGLSDGNYTYDVTIVDTANNINATPSRTFRVDNTKPNITVVFPTSSDISALPINLNIVTNENCLCNYSYDGGTNYTLTSANNITHNASISSFPNGIHTFDFYCFDLVLNSNSTNKTNNVYIVISGAGASGGGAGVSTYEEENETFTVPMINQTQLISQEEFQNVYDNTINKTKEFIENNLPDKIRNYSVPWWVWLILGWLALIILILFIAWLSMNTNL